MTGTSRIAAGALACALAARLTAAGAAAATAPRQELTAGAGKETVVQLCASSCHGAERIISEHRSKSQWQETIQTMKDAGATGTADELKAVLSYLIAHAGTQVKINTATARQIDDVLDLEPGQAAAIVAYRDTNGAFKDWADLMKVPGLDAKKLEEQKNNVIF
jgi:competence ComEA-like helix-hairpin-helix protein